MTSKPRLLRRHIIASMAGLTLAPLAACAQTPAAGRAADMVVTLLGTGSPAPEPERYSAATLVEAGGLRLLFDAGRGATIRLGQVGVALGSLSATLLTHLHSDHVVGLPDVWLMGFINPNYGARKGALRVIGPRGTQSLVDNMVTAFAGDVNIRIADQNVDRANTLVRAEEFDGDGVVFEQGGVKVTAFSVDHGERVKPAYGFRVDYNGRSVLISGDTRYDEKVVRHGTGVDLLVHEVGEAPDAIKSQPWVRAIMAHHTSAEECGVVFSKARPKLAAYTHLVMLYALGQERVTVTDLVAKTRKTYAGPLVVGSDLMRFEIGDTVRALRWDALRSVHVPVAGD